MRASERTRLLTFGLFGLALTLATTAPARAQLVQLDTELPRLMVLLDDSAETASTALTGFLADAGFPVVDPLLARTAADRALARQAVAGDRVAAVQLGRSLGAHVLVVGTVNSSAGPNPAAPSLQTGNATLNLRALRLDEGRLVASITTSSRGVEATADGARQTAVQNAVDRLVGQTAFIGNLVTDWTSRGWDNTAYWTQASTESAPSRPTGDLVVGIVEAELGAGGRDTRGIGVGARQDADEDRGIGAGGREDAGEGQVRVRGFVPATGDVRVWVGDVRAQTRPANTEERSRHGLDGPTTWFEAVVPAREVLSVRAEAGGREGRTSVHPRMGRRWAVVVGISDYRDRRISQLRFADDDAREMYEFLTDPDGGGVSASNVRLLLNEEATASAIREALFVFLQQAAPEDYVFIYFASHGAPDPGRPSNLYVIPNDADIDAVASTAFPMWDFKTALHRQVQAERVLVMVDACHSGGILPGEANPIGSAVRELVPSGRRLTLSAAAAEELSHEGEEWGGGNGVFTYTLLRGLRGEADQNGDGVVSFSEAATYVQTRVPAETGGQQNPQRSGFGDLPIRLPIP